MGPWGGLVEAGGWWWTVGRRGESRLAPEALPLGWNAAGWGDRPGRVLQCGWSRTPDKVQGAAQEDVWDMKGATPSNLANTLHKPKRRPRLVHPPFDKPYLTAPAAVLCACCL